MTITRMYQTFLEVVMRILRSTVLTLLLLVLLISESWAGQYPVTPVTNNGEKWRIGYLEGGMYPDYQIIFFRTVKGLMELGWIGPMDLPETYNPNHRQAWQWLAENVRSDYLEFVGDAFYTSEFKADQRVRTKQELIDRLSKQNDLDLILAMGTWAGQDLANDEHSTPTVVASTSDPLGSGIIKSAEDSGFRHLHAKIEPDRYIRQLRLFHDITHFRTMGIVFEDTLEGRTFAAVADAEQVARERGFELKTCHARNSDITLGQAAREALACYENLAPQVEAMYITVHRGESLENLPNLLNPLLKNGVATFAMPGSEFVKNGVLLSIAHADFAYVGRFHAETMARIFNGANPSSLEQRWAAPSKIAINLKTAETIGFDPPFDVLAAADEIYDHKTGVSQR
ncbi:ABC transporter substrate-binding protein [Desulfobotulus sp. H1]|uniref:ABC transporter substrate-binding protein n=1 Tax=Desulfobotulus pelophilus TaxID=2823377 RepID=A0ABT3N5E9_9BACT|nr:ABC transporter substrate binding protein [Desulfobotulus pelophilus]MCW7752683.1 ABC transporter substrate-binding protein [Desulfobotulus pelophilus]